MKKIYMVLGTLIVVLLLGIAALPILHDGANFSALIGLSGTQRACGKVILNSYDEKIKTSEMEFTKSDLNNDGLSDFIVRLKSDATCGSAGCLYELCIQNKESVQQVPFGFAGKTIEPTFELTNGMKDIVINDDDRMRLVWDGTRYVPIEP